MTMLRSIFITSLVLLVASCGGNNSNDTLAQGNGGANTAQSGQCKHHNPNRQAFFGDLHVHTVYSLDANTQGTIVDPHDAYRFAKGERLGIQPYLEDGTATRFTQLARPLDFAAVTDHAELFGEVEICTNPDYLEYNLPECQIYRQSPENAFLLFNFLQLGLPELPSFPIPDGLPIISELPVLGADGRIPRLAFCGALDTNLGILAGATCLEAAKTPWRDIQAAAENHNDRSDDCDFSTFVAYEYTAAPLSNNLHRNVIFKTAVVPEIPPAYQENPHPELLWKTLSEECSKEAGCEYLTIPHNSNLSAGLMFETKDRFNNNYTAEFATTRQLNEPLAEIYQHKGQSECLGTTGAGANDELCGFELIPYNNLTGDRFGGLNTGDPLPGDFLREAMKDGLKLQKDLGVNPFKYGLIGSSDTHLGTPGNVEETPFPGHGGAGENPADGIEGLTDVIEASPGGLAVLYAEENTRESLFDAMRRREAYATSGTRPIVRFFGGWDIPANACGRSDFVDLGYANGVPMGGDLAAQPSDNAAPIFAVSALRDPGGTGVSSEPLQRIQIIKGWVDADGEKHEEVFEVAGDPNNGASVDTQTCQTSGPGFANLCSVWTDNNFEPEQHAFYYARVVENPSCRWSTHQCVAAAVDCDAPETVPEAFANCCNADYPKTIQERAWTSPIWYQPAP